MFLQLTPIFPLPFQAYLALPKGGLVKEHVLVLPIGHYPSSVDSPKVTVLILTLTLSKYCCDIFIQEVLEELEQFKQSLRTSVIYAAPSLVNDYDNHYVRIRNYCATVCDERGHLLLM